mmetsp:Transcript_19243/g.29050  ORF Transcript_19243/g.29050 Transcript_19243/m.29050 type:complete len:246 (+) Transcript_19243:1-738(+)
MRLASTLAAAVALTSSTVSAFVAPASSISTATTTHLKMSKVEQPDVSAYMTGARPEGTENYIMQQTMVRVKDPKASLDFYCNVLGFKLLMYREFPQWEFNVYFVAPIADASTIPEDEDGRWAMCMNTPGCLELTWNYGSEKEDGLVYNTGNGDSTGTSDGQKIKGGFGHIGITVPNVYRACERFKEMGCEFHKSPNSGGMKGLAFIKDPDGYLIEILPQGKMVPEAIDCMGVAAEGGEGYKDNSK